MGVVCDLGGVVFLGYEVGFVMFGGGGLVVDFGEYGFVEGV